MSQPLDFAAYRAAHFAAMCHCGGCDKTRAEPAQGDGWTVTLNVYGVHDVLCNECSLERQFSEHLQDTATAFFKALFGALHPTLRRTVWDSLDCAMHQVTPPCYPDCKEFDVLTQYALFEDSSGGTV